MATEKNKRKQYAPEDRVTGSLSMLKRHWDKLQELSKVEGKSMSAYVVDRLKLNKE